MDVFNPADVEEACHGVDIAFYLIHSMAPEHDDFAKADREAAYVFASACEKERVDRIVYLSGLGEEGDQLSKHLKSRAEVAQIFINAPVSHTIFKASIIIGSGSASFEMLRYLVDRIPMMITPKWVNSKTQPIAIRNVLNYLSGAVECEDCVDKSFDIGGPDVLTYRKLMELYAEVAGLQKPFIVPVPVFTPKLSSYWIHFVTPVISAIARPLVEGLKNDTIATEDAVRTIIPQDMLTCHEAIKRALTKTRINEVETHWSDAGELPPPEYVYPGDPEWSGGTVYSDVRFIKIESTPEEAWQQIVKIGGETGWYYGNTLWQIRGLMDLFFGGFGLGRGRKHPVHLSPGDALDFWRVIEVTPQKHLKLLAEMKVPGEAYLEFLLYRLDDDKTSLMQIARFAPHGLLGILYWLLVTPLHHFIFTGMLTGIAKAGNIPITAAPTKINLKQAFLFQNDWERL